MRTQVCKSILFCIGDLMRFIRYLDEKQTPVFGWVLENKVGRLEGSPFSEYRRL